MLLTLPKTNRHIMDADNSVKALNMIENDLFFSKLGNLILHLIYLILYVNSLHFCGVLYK